MKSQPGEFCIITMGRTYFSLMERNLKIMVQMDELF